MKFYGIVIQNTADNDSPRNGRESKEISDRIPATEENWQKLYFGVMVFVLPKFVFSSQLIFP